jgi:hypothetical protein
MNIPADRILGRGFGLVAPLWMDHAVVRVADMAQSLPFYDLFFARTQSPVDGEVWFQAEDTTIRVSQQEPGLMPTFERYGVRVGPFDQVRVENKIAEFGGTVLSTTTPGAVRFADPDGLQVELVST